MELGDLMDAVEGAIKEAYPGEPVYRDLLPRDFKRPSFTLECRKVEDADANAGLIRRTAELLVTCLEKVNAYSDSSRDELNRRQDRLMGRFSLPLRVGDRVLTPQARRGLGSPECAEVTLVFSWMEARTTLSGQTPNEGPMMEHIEWRRKD
ncbi:phage tail terminator family protein [Vermiculatibacterium agrestimuris]|uniref:phage tail terminator family protein n=1 Tax=Vermiculatibacterium agrestimuris TaxID=2941519 RepID=UPI00203DDE2B|nr:hypothetical protein [Vermiculatibacterium agrestimuris]